MLFQKGQIAWNKKEPLRKECPCCNKIFYVKPSLDRVVFCSRSCVRKGQPSLWKGRSPSLETRNKMRLAKIGIRGEKHWNWKGGYPRTNRNMLMQRQDYRDWRKSIFDRDDYTCVMCKRTKVYLNAHHKKSWRDFPDLRYDINNGMTVCEPCHKILHRREK